MNRKSVLFLGADPTGGSFSIEEEFQRVKAELSSVGHDAFEIASDLDLQPEELQRLLNQHHPDLLHFSGHVTEEGDLLLVDRAGKGRVAAGNLVARILSSAPNRIRCLVLNSCNGDALAPALSGVDVVVAMEGMVSVRASQAFSVRFYEALAGRRSVEAAFQQGLLEAELAGFGSEITARLLEREPGLADGLVFADASGSRPRARAAAAVPERAPRRSNVFISYSHRDKEWMDRLSTMLRPLERSIDIEVWDDRRIAASANWRDEINGALAHARVAILLVSPDFLASEFINEKELPVILDARERALIEVLWIYLAPCLIGETRLADIQAAHTPMRPVVSLPASEQGDVFLQVATRTSQLLRTSN